MVLIIVTIWFSQKYILKIYIVLKWIQMTPRDIYIFIISKLFSLSIKKYLYIYVVLQIINFFFFIVLRFGFYMKAIYLETLAAFPSVTNFTSPNNCSVKSEKNQRKFEMYLLTRQSLFWIKSERSRDHKIAFILLRTRYLLSLIHIWRCRRYSLCRSRWSPYH